MNDGLIQEELERLRIRKEKDLHNGLVDRLRREPAEENWELAESVFAPEELAEVSARERRLGFYLKLDFAAFWLSVFFMSFSTPTSDIGALGLIGLLFVSFFGWWVLLFLRRAHRQDFTREFTLRLEARKKVGRKKGPGEEDLP